ncbi:MAG: hypothetical protein V4608_05920 [Bacteroidota bacterium]
MAGCLLIKGTSGTLAPAGKSSLLVKDKKTLKRLEDIEKLPDNDKQNIFYTLDNLIKAAKLKTL